MAAHLQLSGDNGPKMECRGNAIDGCSTHSVSQPASQEQFRYVCTNTNARKEKAGGSRNPRFTQHLQLLIISEERMANINLAQFFVALFSARVNQSLLF